MDINTHTHNMKSPGKDLVNSEQTESLLQAMRVLLIAPIFIYVAVPFKVYLLYYAFCLIFPLAALFFGIGRNAKIDPFILWLIAWFLIACTLDLINGSPKVTYTAILGYTMSVLLMVIVFEVRFREMSILLIIGAVIYYWYRIFYLGYVLSDHGRALALTVISLVFFIKKQHKAAFFSLVLFFPLIGRNAWLALSVSLFTWFIFRSVRTSAVKRRLLLIAVLISVIAIPMLVGIFFGDSLEMFFFTTQRSLFYSVMVDEAFSRGLDILLPVSNTNAEVVLTEYISTGVFESFEEKAGIIEKYYANFSRQIPHSAYLEILINYGVIIMAGMLIWLVMLGNQKTWPLIVHFMVAIMTDSEYFAPFWIVPYCIAYRELYFYHDQDNIHTYQTAT